MYYSTRGIFLRKVKYSETSVIAGIYTEEFGLQSYIIKNARSKRSKISPGLLQPLVLLDMVVSHREKANLNYIKEMRNGCLADSLLTDIRKSAVILFLDELLIKTLQEENKNTELFNFIFESVRLLDSMEGNISIFHLVFALKLTKYLGFYPQGSYSSANNSFDMEEGSFTIDPGIEKSTYLRGDVCEQFALLMALSYEKVGNHRIKPATKSALLEKILLFYSLHIPTAVNFKSHNVLHEVFR